MNAHPSPNITLSRFRRLLLYVGVGTMVLFVGFGCKGGTQSVSSLPQVNLQYWTAFDDPSDYSAVIAAFHAEHPNVQITVRKFSYTDYYTNLLAAWARGDGPDIFSIPNTSVGKYRDLIDPLPASLRLPTLVARGGCSKNSTVVESTVQTYQPTLLDQTFLPVVADDVIWKNKIYGLPLAADTLSLFYNKDLLTQAQIIAPPQTWQELTDMVDETKGGLTKENAGTLVQSGIALGSADNVDRSVDILSLLMMQSGAQMVDSSGQTVTFDQASATDKSFIPGASALTFYTSFADPSRVAYSWNDAQPGAEQAFASGKVAFFLGYSYDVPLIRQANPQLNFGLAPVPQISMDGPQIDYANYWVETVAAKTAHPNEAWDFLMFETSAQHVTPYLQQTKKPTALKGLLISQKDDLDLSVFVNQLLLAKTWYHGSDDAAMETDMKQMITSVNAGTAASDALSLAARQIQQTYLPKQ